MLIAATAAALLDSFTVQLKEKRNRRSHIIQKSDQKKQQNKVGGGGGGGICPPSQIPSPSPSSTAKDFRLLHHLRVKEKKKSRKSHL